MRCGFWGQGQALADKLLQPVEHRAPCICGEAWSHEQGWVEGGLNTAEAMLAQHFGGPPAHDTDLS